MQLGQATDYIVGEIESTNNDIDSLFAEIDNSLEVSRLTFGDVLGGDEGMQPQWGGATSTVRVDWDSIQTQVSSDPGR